MASIRILMYTDHANISENLGDWGLTDLQNFIRLKLKNIADVQIDVRNRHLDEKKAVVQGATKLTEKLLSSYDELWVFGYRMKDFPPEEPENELTPEEEKVLCSWMRRGGVLITGDHSENPVKTSNCATDDHEDYLNLGRAIGSRIPRAGKLRVWQGPPTHCVNSPLEDRDNFNTQEKGAFDLDDRDLQEDENPQNLFQTPSPPHRLLWWHVDDGGHVVPIEKFPDHMHEGKLEPKPSGTGWDVSYPQPVVVAKGTDKRFPLGKKVYNLVLAFDGAAACVGRIVADSSFHHYININLKGLKERDSCGTPVPGSDLDQIAQYYANLALWLAPEDVRQKIKDDLLFRILTHSEVFETLGNSLSHLGMVVDYVIRSQVGYSNLFRVFAPSDFEGDPTPHDLLLSWVLLKDAARSEFVAREEILGSIAQAHHQHLSARGIHSPSLLESAPVATEVLRSGFMSAHAQRSWAPDQFSKVRELAEAAWGVGDEQDGPQRGDKE